MAAEIVQLNAHDSMTVEEALSQCLREGDSYENVIILATDKETGKTIVRSSGMERATAAWLCDEGKFHAHGRLDE